MTHIDKLLIETQTKNIFVFSYVFSMFYNNGMSLTNNNPKSSHEIDTFLHMNKNDCEGSQGTNTFIFFKT